MNILEAIAHKDVYRPFLGDLATWAAWGAFLRCLYGLPIPQHHHGLVEQCTGRPASTMPKDGFRQALLLCGRRSGKSRIAALVSSYEASIAEHPPLARGEQGMVICCSPTLKQSRVVRRYIQAAHATPLMEAEIADADRHGFTLCNGTRVEVLSGEHRSIRGYTAIAAVVDEIAMFNGLDEDARIKSDTELVRALEPALLTQNGLLLCIGTPYRAAGWSYQTWKANWGNPAGDVLVWRAPSNLMNPTLSQAAIDRAMARDPAAARTEYYAEFREDISGYVTRAILDLLVVKGRQQLPPRPGMEYVAFGDCSGGVSDAAALAIGHREGRVLVVDYCQEYPAPHSPYAAVGQMVDVLRRYGIRKITTDAYAAEFAAEAFRSRGIRHERSDLNKSALYLELLPRLMSALTTPEIELPDHPKLLDQLASLERRTRSGSKDTVDHPPNGHDDVANAVAGLAAAIGQRRVKIGAMAAVLGWDDSDGVLATRRQWLRA